MHNIRIYYSESANISPISCDIIMGKADFRTVLLVAFSILSTHERIYAKDQAQTQYLKNTIIMIGDIIWF